MTNVYHGEDVSSVWPLNAAPCPLMVDGDWGVASAWAHLVCGDCKLFGAVHHVRGSVLRPTQSLAALVQSLAGLLHGAAHAVGSRVQYAVACRRGGGCGLAFQSFPRLTVMSKTIKCEAASIRVQRGKRAHSWVESPRDQLKLTFSIFNRDWLSVSRKASQRCFPSNFYFSRPFLLLSPLLERLLIKRGWAPASGGSPRHPAVDRRRSTSSTSPGSPAGVSTDKPLICHTWGVLLLCATHPRLPAARSLSVTRYIRFERGVGGVCTRL